MTVEKTRPQQSSPRIGNLTMKGRKLGKTDLMVSPICIGAWQLGGPLSFDGKPDGHPDPGKGVVISMIRKLSDLGVNFIDTDRNPKNRPQIDHNHCYQFLNYFVSH